MIRLLTESSRLGRTHSGKSKFRSDVITGLSAEPKRLSCKYFYDERVQSCSTQSVI